MVGSALAFSLARSGRTVCLLERDLSKPDRIVGELLQPGGVRALSLLGLGDCLDGIDAIPVEGYQVFYGPRSVPIGYPVEDESEKGLGVDSVTGKVEGRSFHHGNFVDALRKRASAQSGVTMIEATVKDIATNAHGTITGVIASEKHTSSSASPSTLNIEASVTVIADGCFSKFRKTHGSSIAPIVRSNFVALELTHAPLPAPYHGHVVLSPSGPILLYQISTQHTRILIDVPGEKLPSVSKGDLQAHIRDKVIPSLPEGLRPCVSQTLESGQRLRSMPNSFLPPSMQGQTENRKGVIVVGDAMNMRHPLTGGGMSVGLWDCVHLTRALGGAEWSPPFLKSESPQQFTTPPSSIDLRAWSDTVRPALRSWHWSRKPLASVINILAQALYSLFGADDEALSVLREGCFKYFEMGGECVAGPVGLLSGLRPRPTLLVYHFFKVALFSIWCLFAHPRVYASRGEEIVRRPGLAELPSLTLKSILVFYTACVVILPVIWTEIKANAPTFEDVASSATIGDQAKGKKIRSRRSIQIILALAMVIFGLYYVQVPQDVSLRGSDGPNDGPFHDLLGRVNSSFRPAGRSGYMEYLPVPKKYLA